MKAPTEVIDQLRLMVAAPMLLEALELALPAVAMHTPDGARSWPKHTPMNEGEPDMAAIVERIRAAIALTRGDK